MPATFVDERARQALREAVVAIEAASSAEVVIAVRRQSSGWLHVNVAVGVAAMVAALAYMLYGRTTFSLLAILIDPLAVGLGAALAAELVAPLKRALTPARWRRRAVERAARATFVERGVHNTRGRTGVLLYVSWLERRATLVADVGALAAVPAPVWAAAQARLDAAVRVDGVAVAGALAALAPTLAPLLPRAADDVNELSDELDAHVGRAARPTGPQPTAKGGA